jgi:hypothetical protein
VQKQEYQHNTYDQVLEYLSDALQIVERLEPPDDLRAALFVQACGLFSAKQIVFEQMPALSALTRQ